jgi:hypothetical protein
VCSAGSSGKRATARSQTIFRGGRQRIRRGVHRPHLEGALGERALPQDPRQAVELRRQQRLLALERLGIRGVGHLVGVIESRLGDLKRRGEVEDRLPLLQGHDAAGRERTAVADAVDVVHDRPSHVARAEKVGVNGVGDAVGRDREGGRRQRLPQDLPAVDRAPAEILALAAEQVLLDAFEGQQGDELFENARHTAG